MKTFILTLASFFMFTSCSDNADLGDSYYYLDPFEARDIGHPDGAIIYKSKKKLVFETTIVSKEVVQVSHTDKFIFAKQLAGENTLDTSYYIIDKKQNKVYGPTGLDSCEKLKLFIKMGL